MNSKTDFSQYEVKEENPTFQPTNTDSAWTNIKNNASNFFYNFGNPNGEKEKPKEEPKEDKFAQYEVKEEKKKKSKLEQGLRVAAQYGLGRLEGSPGGLVYDIAVSPLANKEAQNMAYRESLGEDLETLMNKKASGEWDEKDQELYDHITEQILDPKKSMQYAQTADLSIRSLAEKAAGQDLHPEGFLEKGAHWVGLVKGPRVAKELVKMGSSPKQIIKNIFPTVKETSGALFAGTALEMAEKGNLGPLGTMAAAIVSDLIGRGIPGLAKGIIQPKKTLFKGLNFLANTKNEIKNDIKKAAGEKEFTKDLGTLTDNNIVKMIQARLAASGLFGEPLQELRKKMTQEIVEEYESILKELGEVNIQSTHELGELAKSGIKELRDVDLAQSRLYYSQAEKALKEGALVNSSKLANAVAELEKKLSPGAIKSTEQKAVLDVIEKLKKDIYETKTIPSETIIGPEGEEIITKSSSKTSLKDASVKDLINNKIALNDIINYEVQGGTKQLLKNLVGELDRAIISHGKENSSFAKNYIQANKKFSEHAKTFRNKSVDQLLKTLDPAKIMNKLDSIQGIRDLKKILSRTSGGKELFNNLARRKLDNMIGKNMKDGITEQLKSGKFFNIIENPKNKEILKELLSPQAYKRLMHLQKHVGKLAESAQKFFNASQSATALADLTAVGTILSGVFGLLTGNPFALVGSSSLAIGANQLSKLIADPEFLRLVENAIKASEKNNIKLMNIAGESLIKYTQQVSPALIKTGTES